MRGSHTTRTYRRMQAQPTWAEAQQVVRCKGAENFRTILHAMTKHAVDGFYLAVLLKLVDDGCLDSPASLGLIDRHAVTAEGARRAVLQILVVLGVVCCIVPADRLPTVNYSTTSLPP